MLTERELARYNRNIRLFGETGQEKLKQGRVLVVGAGGVGSAALLDLAAMGVGSITIADGDRVELSNLQRQIVHDTARLGENKAGSAAQTLRALNPEISLHVMQSYVTADEMKDLAADHDFVIDAADGIQAKLIINDGCVAAGTPFCHCGTHGFRGQVMTCIPGQSPCVRCVFGQPEGAISGGTAAPACGTVGILAAAEAIKYLTGLGSLLTGRLLTFDLLTMESRTARLHRSEACPVCGRTAL